MVVKIINIWFQLVSFFFKLVNGRHAVGNVVMKIKIDLVFIRFPLFNLAVNLKRGNQSKAKKIKKIPSGFLFSTWPTCTWQPGHEDKCVCATCICTQPDSPMQCIARIYICKSWNFSFSRTCAHLLNSRQFHSIDKVGLSAIKHRRLALKFWTIVALWTEALIFKHSILLNLF